MRSSSRVGESPDTSVSDLASPSSSSASWQQSHQLLSPVLSNNNRLQLFEQSSPFLPHVTSWRIRVSSWWVDRHQFPQRLGRLGFFCLPPALSAVQFLRDPMRNFRLRRRAPARPPQGFHLHLRLGPPILLPVSCMSALKCSNICISVSCFNLKALSLFVLICVSVFDMVVCNFIQVLKSVLFAFVIIGQLFYLFLTFILLWLLL